MHIHASILSLPISPWLTLLTVFLPILVALNAIFYPLLRRAHPHLRTVGAATAADPVNILSIILETLLGILTTVLSTLFAASAIPSELTECLLSGVWEGLFAALDAASIIRIQDSLNCCGYNSVKDRAWPFNWHKSGFGCAEMYGRRQACCGPWSGELRQDAWLDFFVTLASGLLEVSRQRFWKRTRKEEQ